MGSLERDRGEEEGEVLHKKSWLALLQGFLKFIEACDLGKLLLFRVGNTMV